MSDHRVPRHHRPLLPGAGRFEALSADADPAARSEAADRCATLLVRGAHDTDDELVIARVVHLADTEGLDTLADLWSGSPADSLAGCLWRLYLLRSWVHADPRRVAREFDAGRRHAPVAEVVAGVAEPPGPAELKAMVDDVLSGIAGHDFADVLQRAAAFARVVATGRAAPGLTPADEASPAEVRRMLVLAEQLETAVELERSGMLA